MTEWAVDLWVPIKVVPKGRPRLGRRRRVFTPMTTQIFEAAVKEAYLAADLPHFGKIPMVMEVDVYIDGFQLKLMPAECSVRPVNVRGDLDNIQKAISDGLNDVAYSDDRQIELVSIGFVGIPRKGTHYDEGVLPVSEMQASDVRADGTEFETDPTLVPVQPGLTGPDEDGTVADRFPNYPYGNHPVDCDCLWCNPGRDAP